LPSSDNKAAISNGMVYKAAKKSVKRVISPSEGMVNKSYLRGKRYSYYSIFIQGIDQMTLFLQRANKCVILIHRFSE
jgi:hypothetical protein